ITAIARALISISVIPPRCAKARPSGPIRTDAPELRQYSAHCKEEAGQTAPARLSCPLPLAGEGTTVCPRTRMGEGSSRGEASSCPRVVLLTKQPISFPRRGFAPGLCLFASLTPSRGGSNIFALTRCHEGRDSARGLGVAKPRRMAFVRHLDHG